jgi:hypothetical protein
MRVSQTAGWAIAIAAFGGAAAAEETAPSAEPRFHFAPMHNAVAGAPLKIVARVTGDWRLAKLSVFVRPAFTSGGYEAFPIERSEGGDFVGEIPGARVLPPGIEIFVASEGTDAAAREHFASAAHPHRVMVYGESNETRTLELLEGIRGHKNRVELGFGLSAFGAAQETPPPLESFDRSDPFSDRYWLISAEYTHRPLAPLGPFVLYDFRFGAGVMRANLPTVASGARPSPLGRTVGSCQGLAASECRPPGLTYAYGGVNLEFHRFFSAGAKLVLGVTATGFAAGLEGVARIGRIDSSHFSAQFEYIWGIGVRSLFAFRWTTLARLPMALGLELFDWPDSRYGTASNLFYEIGFEVTESLTVIARAGGANRARSLGYGVQGGLSAQLDF